MKESFNFEEVMEVFSFVRGIITEEVEREGYEVKRILLFGSRARGEADKRSDWDFYVVIAPSAPEHLRWDIAERICERLAEVGIWADVLIQNETTVLQRVNDPGCLTYYVFREGIELYSPFLVAKSR